MKALSVIAILALPIFSVFAQRHGSYDQLIINASSSLKTGQLDEAREDIQWAIRLNATNYLAYAVAAKIASKQGDSDDANQYIQKALELAPDDEKDKIHELAQQIQSPTPTPSTSTESQSTTPAPLSDDDQLKHDGLMQILADAAKSDSDDDRKDLFRQFLTRSVDFADAHPDQTDIWEGRAYAAIDLDYPDTGWLAGKQLKALGAVHSDDPKLHDIMVQLESKGWLEDDTCPQRDWSKWTTAQAQAAANQGDADAQDAMGDLYRTGQSGLSQDYIQALDWYQKSAAQGNVTREGDLAQLYEMGWGMVKDYGQALDWYRKAASQGSSFAQVGLGDMYRNGWGVTRDYAQALDWYQKSAAQGNSSGQCGLGILYENGLGVTRDYAQALDEYQKSATQGDADAQGSLGEMYENGKGVTQDYGQALNWLQKSAAQGNAYGEDVLGVIYQNGSGVEKDIVQARNWYQKAADQGNADAKTHLAALSNNSQ